MANWSNPLLTSTYTNFVDEVKTRDEDLARGFDPAFTTPTNIPTNTIRWNSASNTWQKWNGTAWNALAATYAISISGNAATATTATTAGNVTGTVAAANGGTGQTTYAIGDLLFASGTSALSRLAGVATGNALISGGVGTAPSWGKIGLTTHITGTLPLANGGTNATTADQARINLGAITALTGSATTPVGTTAQRDATPQPGYFRFNSTLGQFEGYNGTAWGKVGGGATGGGTDDVFLENGQTVNTNYTLTSGKNAVSAGPITIASGVTVTVPAGSNWAIV